LYQNYHRWVRGFSLYKYYRATNYTGEINPSRQHCSRDQESTVTIGQHLRLNVGGRSGAHQHKTDSKDTLTSTFLQVLEDNSTRKTCFRNFWCFEVIFQETRNEEFSNFWNKPWCSGQRKQKLSSLSRFPHRYNHQPSSKDNRFGNSYTISCLHSTGIQSYAKPLPLSRVHFSCCSPDRDLVQNIVTLKHRWNRNPRHSLLLRRGGPLSFDLMWLVVESSRLL